MELDSLYQEVILEHYKRPLHKSLKEDPTIQVHHINTSCGDEITLNLHTDGEVVEDITWEGIGCSISQASTSVVSDLVRGKSITETLAIIDAFQAMIQSKGADSGDEGVLGDAHDRRDLLGQAHALRIEEPHGRSSSRFLPVGREGCSR